MALSIMVLQKFRLTVRTGQLQSSERPQKFMEEHPPFWNQLQVQKFPQTTLGSDNSLQGLIELIESYNTHSYNLL